MAKNNKDSFKIWEYVERLYATDTAVREALLVYFGHSAETFVETEKHVINSKIFGSLAEGAFIARSICNGNMTIEVDVGKEIGHISEEMFNDSTIFMSLENEGKPGFFKIKSCREVKNTLIPQFRDDYKMCFKEDEYFHHPTVEHMGVIRSDQNAPEFFKDAHIEGPSVTLEYPFKSGNLVKLLNIVHSSDISGRSFDDITMSQDYVLCLKVNSWPSSTTITTTKTITTPKNGSDFIAKSNPKSKWIKEETMNQIIQQGFHLVPKSSSQIDGHIITSEWRLSFSQAEGILSDSLSEFQKKCYLVAKIIFYINFKNIEDGRGDEARVLSSYLMKTIKFSLQEEPLPSCSKDTEQDLVMRMIAKYFQRLGDVLKTGFLPCYFYTKVNLLDGFSPEFLNETSNIAHQIAGNVSNYINEWPLTIIHKWTAKLQYGGDVALKRHDFILSTFSCTDHADGILETSMINYFTGDPSSLAIQRVCKEIGLVEVYGREVEMVFDLQRIGQMNTVQDMETWIQEGYKKLKRSIQELLRRLQQEDSARMKKDQEELTKKGLLDDPSRNRRFDLWMDSMIRGAKIRATRAGFDADTQIKDNPVVRSNCYNIMCSFVLERALNPNQSFDLDSLGWSFMLHPYKHLVTLAKLGLITKESLKHLFQKYRFGMYFKTSAKTEESNRKEDPRQHCISYSRVNLKILFICFLCVTLFIIDNILQLDFDFCYMYFYFLVIFYKLSYGCLKNTF